MTPQQILAIIAIVRAIATVSIETWQQIAALLKLSEQDAEQIRTALMTDRPKLEALVAHLQERVPEDE